MLSLKDVRKFDQMDTSQSSGVLWLILLIYSQDWSNSHCLAHLFLPPRICTRRY